MESQVDERLDPALADQVERFRFAVLALQRSGNRILADLLRPVGLSPAQAEILSVLDTYGTLSLRELGKLLICEQGSPSRSVDLLVTQGLVDRRQNPDDRRAIILTLTARGRDAVPAIRAANADLLKMIVARIAPDTLNGLTAAIERLIVDDGLRDALNARFRPIRDASELPASA